MSIQLPQFWDRHISKVEEGTINNWPVVRITLEGGQYGCMDKERFMIESKIWPVDTQDNLLIPENYLLSKRGYWYIQEEMERKDHKEWNRRISSALEGTINSLPVYKVTIETGQSGYIAKDRFEREAINWPVDTDDTILLPEDYRLSHWEYWYKKGWDRNGLNFSKEWKLI